MKSIFTIDGANNGEKTKIGDTQVVITDFTNSDNVVIEILHCDRVKDCGKSEWGICRAKINKEELARVVRSIL